MFENHRKSASGASYVYILSGQKLIKMPKMLNLASFGKPEACGQTVLPDRSVSIGQKLVENAKIEKKSNATFWVIFKHCGLSENSKLDFFD